MVEVSDPAASITELFSVGWPPTCPEIKITFIQFQMDNEPKTSFEWMMTYGTTPPKSLMLKNITVFKGDTQAMAFIKYVSIPFIPKQFWHVPYLQNTEGKTVAMLAIEREIPIIYPIWQHDPNIQDNDGNTIAMLAISHNMNIESWMQHDPSLQDKNGNTIAMLFMQKRLMYPPKWMQHGPNIQDKNGNTIAMLFIAVFKEEPLFWMKCNPFIRNIRGATIYDVWKNIMGTIPPEWIKECPYLFIRGQCKCNHSLNYFVNGNLLCDECANKYSNKQKVYYTPECTICRDTLKTPVVMKKCGHIFCKHCLETWIQTSNMCPFGCKL